MEKWEIIDESFNTGDEIINFIKENKITNYSEFLIYCKNNNKKWFLKMCRTPNMRKYFKN
ncbi:MAG: hypothetical protein IJ410_02625 [Oscillospiraceae bacterium]|nr:hypothetical protein [Oscillospiraceae bacterium]